MALLARSALCAGHQSRRARHQPVFGGMALRHCQGSSSKEDQAGQVAAELERQRRLSEASSVAMNIHYCRERGNTKVWRWFRSLSIDVNYDFRRWRKHQKATRNLSLWTPLNIMRADNIRRLVFPDLLTSGLVSSVLCYYNAVVAADAALTLPMECFSTTSVALGLLVTFKTNSCYSRFDDARAQWGLIVNETRSLASRILSRVPSPLGSHGHLVMQARRHAVKLIKTFPLVLKYHLTEDGCNPHIICRKETTEAEVKAATTLALQAELQLIWDMADSSEAEISARILAAEGGNRPLLVLHELGHINADVFSVPGQGSLEPIVSVEIDRSITVLHHILGRSERILRTPIYTPYTKFTSRFLGAWCSSLPLALYPLLGPLATTPISLIISFFLLGIQDIGSRVEQPFDVLPLWQYCQNVSLSCDQMLRHSERLRELSADALEDGKYDYLSDISEDTLRSFVDPI